MEHIQFENLNCFWSRCSRCSRHRHHPWPQGNRRLKVSTQRRQHIYVFVFSKQAAFSCGPIPVHFVVVPTCLRRPFRPFLSIHSRSFPRPTENKVFVVSQITQRLFGSLRLSRVDRKIGGSRVVGCDELNRCGQRWTAAHCRDERCRSGWRSVALCSRIGRT